MTEPISPLAFALGDEYRRRGLRERVPAPPVMAAVVPSLIWRHVPSVAESTRLLEREGLPWAAPRAVSAQALALRLRCLPADLFHRVRMDLLPTPTARAQDRSRPRPAVMTRLQHHYPTIRAVDGSALEALFKQVGRLREAHGTVDGGKLAAILDPRTKPPVRLWLDDDAAANDKRALDRIKAALRATTLLVMDRGYRAFPFFDWLTEHRHGFVTRARANAASAVQRVLLETPAARDRAIQLGTDRSDPRRHPVRPIEGQVDGAWRGCLTNALDPEVLTAADVVEVYARRWRIEDAFVLTKRLLGLSYLWTGASNGVALQVWATWPLYAALVDLTDAVAEELEQPLDARSLERVYRGLDHVTVAHRRGTADEPVASLADPANADLGVVKRRRKHRERTRLDTNPFPLNFRPIAGRPRIG